MNIVEKKQFLFQAGSIFSVYINILFKEGLYHFGEGSNQIFFVIYLCPG